MRIVLNETTKTVHKPARNTDLQPTDCGALRHVPADRIRVATEAEVEPDYELHRCGRCFENGGGY